MFSGLYSDLLIRTVNVKTGTLKGSIQSRIEEFSIITTMLGYGIQDSVWSDVTNPISKLEELYKSNSDGLAKAFMEDLKVEIKDSIKK